MTTFAKFTVKPARRERPGRVGSERLEERTLLTHVAAVVSYDTGGTTSSNGTWSSEESNSRSESTNANGDTMTVKSESAARIEDAEIVQTGYNYQVTPNGSFDSSFTTTTTMHDTTDSGTSRDVTVLSWGAEIEDYETHDDSVSEIMIDHEASGLDITSEGIANWDDSSVTFESTTIYDSFGHDTTTFAPNDYFSVGSESYVVETLVNASGSNEYNFDAANGVDSFTSFSTHWSTDQTVDTNVYASTVDSRPGEFFSVDSTETDTSYSHHAYGRTYDAVDVNAYRILEFGDESSGNSERFESITTFSNYRREASGDYYNDEYIVTDGWANASSSFSEYSRETPIASVTIVNATEPNPLLLGGNTELVQSFTVNVDGGATQLKGFDITVGGLYDTVERFVVYVNGEPAGVGTIGACRGGDEGVFCVDLHDNGIMQSGTNTIDVYAMMKTDVVGGLPGDVSVFIDTNDFMFDVHGAIGSYRQPPHSIVTDGVSMSQHQSVMAQFESVTAEHGFPGAPVHTGWSEVAVFEARAAEHSNFRSGEERAAFRTLFVDVALENVNTDGIRVYNTADDTNFVYPIYVFQTNEGLSAWFTGEQIEFITETRPGDTTEFGVEVFVTNHATNPNQPSSLQASLPVNLATVVTYDFGGQPPATHYGVEGHTTVYGPVFGYNPPVSIVGDGILGPDEECEDSNTVNGDGCDAFGRFEVIVNPTAAGGGGSVTVTSTAQQRMVAPQAASSISAGGIGGGGGGSTVATFETIDLTEWPSSQPSDGGAPEDVDSVFLEWNEGLMDEIEEALNPLNV